MRTIFEQLANSLWKAAKPNLQNCRVKLANHLSSRKTRAFPQNSSTAAESAIGVAQHFITEDFLLYGACHLGSLARAGYHESARKFYRKHYNFKHHPRPQMLRFTPKPGIEKETEPRHNKQRSMHMSTRLNSLLHKIVARHNLDPA